jgi:hypothetical protein
LKWHLPKHCFCAVISVETTLQFLLCKSGIKKYSQILETDCTKSLPLPPIWIQEQVAPRDLCHFNKELYTSSKCLPILHKLIQKHHKKEKTVFWPDLASACSGLVRRAKNWIRHKGRKSSKRTTPTADQKWLGSLERESLRQQLPSKRCKVLDVKDQKSAKVHGGGTGKGPNGHKLDVTFFFSSYQFSKYIKKKMVMKWKYFFSIIYTFSNFRISMEILFLSKIQNDRFIQNWWTLGQNLVFFCKSSIQSCSSASS